MRTGKATHKLLSGFVAGVRFAAPDKGLAAIFAFGALPLAVWYAKVD